MLSARTVFFFTGLFVVTLSPLAEAQAPPAVHSSEERAGASSAQSLERRRDLLERAQAAARAGEDAQALDLALQAGEISWSPSLRLFVARRYASLGRLGLALNSATLCMRAVERSPELANREALRASCLEQYTLLRSRSAYLELTVPADFPSSAEVRVDGRLLSVADRSVPYALDVGEHEIVVAVPGRRDWSQRISSSRGEVRVLELEQGPVSVPTSERRRPPPRSDLSRAGVYTMVIGGSLGVVLGVAGLVGRAVALDGCGSPVLRPDPDQSYTPCIYSDAESEDRVATANTLVGVAITGFSLAGVALGVGASLLIVQRIQNAQQEEEQAFVPFVTPGGVGVRGSF